MTSKGSSIRRLLAGLALILGLSLFGVAQAENAPGRVTHLTSGDTDTWRIDEPDVTKAILEFPQIQFTPGDQVTITAGGCVQTGGFGATWKRYLDPLGPNSDTLYHGMVMIPGAIGGLPADTLDNFARILLVKGHRFTVAAIDEPRRAHLYLGYEDDDYDDNGYSGQDAGTQGQCAIGGSWVEHAFVVVTIVHGGAPPPVAHAKQFDLSVNTLTPNNPAVDPNLILFNPVWARQLDSGRPLPNPFNCGSSNIPSDPVDCTTQTTNWDGSDICTVRGWFSGDAGGHLNWGAATYAGRIYWESHSAPGADDDYNLRIVPPNRAGLTTTNGKTKTTGEPSIEIEFDSDETIDHFTTPWWASFHNAVDADESAYSTWQAAIVDGASQVTIAQLAAAYDAAHAKLLAMTDGHQAIVVGLVGLDEAHCCSTELHPVWALAIQVNDDPRDDTWEIFVRRWGDEGFCSDDQHYLDDLQNDGLTLRLPAPAGATNVTNGAATLFRTRLGEGAGPNISFVPGHGADVTFTMLAPQSGDGERMHGELHLQWTVPATGSNLPAHRPTQARRAHGFGQVATVGVRSPPDEEQTGEGEPEARVRAAVEALPAAQRQAYLARLPARDTASDALPPRPTPTAITSAGVPPQGAMRVLVRRPPTTRAAPDPRKQARDQQRLAAFRSVTAKVIALKETPPPAHPPVHTRPPRLTNPVVTLAPEKVH